MAIAEVCHSQLSPCFEEIYLEQWNLYKQLPPRLTAFNITFKDWY